MTGIHDVDEYFQYQLVSKALEISLKISKIGGSFIGKIFRGKYTKYVVSMFKKHYEEVRVLKPKASRHNSIECFIYCKGKYEHQRDCFPVEDFEVIGCGDGPDSDMTRNLVEKMTLKPLTQPINPPYKDSIDKRRAN
ncbi:putative tRNA methyltransferase [Vairimorpha necatrix]